MDRNARQYLSLASTGSVRLAKMSSLSVQLALEIQCYRLRNRDAFSKSDPYVIVYMSTGAQRPVEIGRTETIKNNLSPHFASRISAQYFFEENQAISLAVFDHDPKTKDDPLGTAETTLGKVVANAGQLLKLQRKAGQLAGGNAGELLLTPHQLGGRRTQVNFKVRGQGLDKADFLGKSDPFFVLEQARKNERGKYAPLHTSEVVPKNLNPVWKEAQVRLDPSVEEPWLRFTVLDEDKRSKPDLIGITEPFTPGQLVDTQKLDLINEKKAKRSKKYKNSGKLLFDFWTPSLLPSFYEYISGILSLNFSIAIDFTASNGPATHPNSLHYMDPHTPNQYLRALRAVGNVLQDYSRDQRWPAMGFGAVMPGIQGTCFNFHLNGQQDPYCYGIAGVEAAYLNALQVARLSGPTNFAPLIRDVTRITGSWQLTQENQFYNILMILTDGAISDMAETTRAIVDASAYPMSIVIIGVGGADFGAMKALDSDDALMRDQEGRTAARDIVQFVSFRDYENQSPAQFASAVLAEIPDKVSEYLSRRGIMPQGQPSPTAVSGLSMGSSFNGSAATY